MGRLILERSNGAKIWLRDGKYHREDGPAIEEVGGEKMWYRDGKLHREDGPAWEFVGGPNCWYRDGAPHRVDGPAVEGLHGNVIWFYKGKNLGENDAGFWPLYECLTDEQRKNPNLLRYMPELASF